MGRKKTHDEETGEKLLDAAEALLEKGGPGAVSARAVAEAVGTTTRAVYSVFGDMDGLIAGLTARGYVALGDNLRSIKPSRSPQQDLVRVGLDGFRAFALARPHLYRITFEQVPPTALQHPKVQTATRESYDVLMGFIVRAQEQGIGAHLPRSDFVISFHAMCQGLAGVELSHQAPPVGAGFWQPLAGKDPEKIWTTAIEALLIGLETDA